MMQEAETASVRIDDDSEKDRPETHLRFSAGKKKGYAETANSLGPVHDSRKGFSSFYRYRPRDVLELHNNHAARGPDPNSPRIPEIHRSVMERIEKTEKFYSPEGLSRFRVVEDDQRTREMLIPEKCRHNVRSLQLARRVLYALNILWTLLFLLFPWARDTFFGPRSEQWAEPTFGSFGLGHALTYLQSSLPGFAANWLIAMRKEPFYLIFFLTGIVLLRLVRHDLIQKTERARREAWTHVVELSDTEAAEWQDERPAEGTWSLFKRTIVPFLVAISLIGGVVTLLFGGYRNVLLPAQDRSDPEIRVPLQTETLAFSTDIPAVWTEAYVEKGKSYRIDFTPGQPWLDWNIPATPDGLEFVPPMLRAASPFKRKLSEPWFSLLQAVGSELGETSRVSIGKVWTAPRSGRLSFFVNDATCYLCPGGPWTFYENNSGTGTLTITLVKEEPSAAPAEDEPAR
jgi:hypothetical protein